MWNKILLMVLVGMSAIAFAKAPIEPLEKNLNPAAKTAPTEELKTLLAGVESLQANFQQQMVNNKGVVLQKSSGKMWLQKPGKFRWSIEGKDKRLVIADGKQIWDYDIDLDQVTVQPFSQGQTSAPIFFLTGDTQSLSKDFTVANLTKNQALPDCDQSFELKPKQSQGAFQWIRVGFKNKALKTLEVLDQLGQQARFQFTELVLNSKIPATQFQFKPPPGVDVVGQS